MDDLVQRLMAKAAKGGVIPIHDVTIEEAAAKIDRLRQLLRAVQTDAGNWLNTDLQYAIEAEVGKPGPYRALDDSGVQTDSTSRHPYSCQHGNNYITCSLCLPDGPLIIGAPGENIAWEICTHCYSYHRRNGGILNWTAIDPFAPPATPSPPASDSSLEQK